MSNARLILGTVQFGMPYGINNMTGKPRHEQVFEILNLAFQKGIHTLDTADMYGDAQPLLGSYMRSTGTPFRINTKFRVHPQSPVADELQRSLEQLGVPGVQVLFYHRFEEMMQHPETLDALQELKSQGLIRQAGVSVYHNEELESCLELDGVDVIQLPFNLLDNASQRAALMDQARAKGKTIQVRSVFLQGLFFKPTDTLPEQLRPLAPYLDRLHQLAAACGLSMFDLALGYALAKDNIDQVLIGVDTIEQLERNLSVSEKPFDRQLEQEIDEILVQETSLLYPYNWK